MKRLFLTSSIGDSIASIAPQLLPLRKLLFITTASEGKSGDLVWLREHRTKIVASGFDVTDFTFTGNSKEEIAAALDATEIICMEGGDALYLLEQIRKTACVELLKTAVENGKTYIGSSAGSIITTPNIRITASTERIAESKLTDFSGLGLVNFHVFVHVQREKYAVRFIEYAKNFLGMHGERVIPLQDNQYIQVEKDMYKIVTV